jgi:hypothetical protein
MTHIPLLCQGRGRLDAAAVADAHGATVRIDDGARPSWWCEVRLTVGDLRRLLEAVEAEADHAAAEVTRII